MWKPIRKSTTLNRCYTAALHLNLQNPNEKFRSALTVSSMATLRDSATDWPGVLNARDIIEQLTAQGEQDPSRLSAFYAKAITRQTTRDVVYMYKQL